jgi:hypothetical protein
LQAQSSEFKTPVPQKKKKNQTNLKQRGLGAIAQVEALNSNPTTTKLKLNSVYVKLDINLPFDFGCCLLHEHILSP